MTHLSFSTQYILTFRCLLTQIYHSYLCRVSLCAQDCVPMSYALHHLILRGRNHPFTLKKKPRDLGHLPGTRTELANGRGGYLNPGLRDYWRRTLNHHLLIKPPVRLKVHLGAPRVVHYFYGFDIEKSGFCTVARKVVTAHNSCGWFWVLPSFMFSHLANGSKILFPSGMTIFHFRVLIRIV